MARASIVLIWICLIAGADMAAVKTASDPNTLSLLMPDVQPKVADTYLCFETKLDDRKPIYITGFKPVASKAVAHHILIYGCEEPGNTGKSWNCGEMKSSKNSKKQPICKGKESIIYAWGMDAPELILPKNVGFKVGGNTHIKSLVLQVHYMDVSTFLPPKNGKDDSGVILSITNKPQAKTAGVYLLEADGSIPPKSTTYMETACAYNEQLTLHPFAYRAHAHKNGQVISGYRVRDGKWTEVGRVSPQLPQMFYPVTSPGLTVEKGDILAARCTMVNEGKKVIKIGNTVKDEMCNFYIMYYVDGDHLNKDRICFTPGPPSWNWGHIKGIHPENAPKTASVDPAKEGALTNHAKEHIKQVDSMINMQKQEMKNNLKDSWNMYEEPQMSKFQRPLSSEWGEEEEQPLFPFEDELNLEVPELSRMNLPDLDEPLNLDDFRMLSSSFEEPLNNERVSIIDDKERGGKGYEVSSDVVKQLNIPNGHGVYKESRKQSGYTWNSADAQPRRNSIRDERK